MEGRPALPGHLLLGLHLIAERFQLCQGIRLRQLPLLGFLRPSHRCIPLLDEPVQLPAG